MKLSVDQHKKVINALSHPWGRVELTCDGHAVVACVERTGKRSMRFEIVVYVDGTLDFKRMEMGDEIGGKFYRTVTRKVHKKATVDALEKSFGKRRTKQYRDAVYKRRCPFFSTASAFVRHIEQHNDQIQLIYPATEVAADVQKD